MKFTILAFLSHANQAHSNQAQNIPVGPAHGYPDANTDQNTLLCQTDPF
jgi:hypothetical protein